MEVNKKIINLSDLSNEEFISRYAAPGMVGLVGGSASIDRAIRKAQGMVFGKKENSLWSHAFLFGEKRIDGHHWLLESDIEVHRKQVRWGVQENRANKYFDKEKFPNLAIMDFGLTEQHTKVVLSEGLNLIADVTRYSLRELLGTLITAGKPGLRSKENILAQEKSFYCSAMVQHCYSKANISFSKGVSAKNITPEDIATTTIACTCYLLVR
jgi:hypothetical protein